MSTIIKTYKYSKDDISMATKETVQPNYELSSNLLTSPEHLPKETLAKTQQVLSLQLAGFDDYEQLLFTARLNSRAEGPLYPELSEKDFTQEAILDSTLKLAAETLPGEWVHDMNLQHDIPDNVSYQQPPELQTVLLTIRAWEQTGHNDELLAIIGEMLDFIEDRTVRDNIAEAMKNARTTGEPFNTHFNLVLSRESPLEKEEKRKEQRKLAHAALHDTADLRYNPYFIDPQNPNNTEYHERLVLQGDDKLVYFTEEAAHRQQLGDSETADERIKQKRRRHYTPAQLAQISLKDDAKKIDMNQFLND